MSTWVAVAVGIIPSIGVGLIFWFALRAVIRADRNERAALARLEEQGDDAPVAPGAGGDDARDAEAPGEALGEASGEASARQGEPTPAEPTRDDDRAPQ